MDSLGGAAPVFFWPSKNFHFIRKFSSKVAKSGSKQLSFWENSGAKLKSWANVISSVGNLQVSVQKLQLPASPSSFIYNPAGCRAVIIVNEARTRSTAQMMSVPSFEPVASLVPSGEKRQNHTSSVWSVNTWLDWHGKFSLHTVQTDTCAIVRAAKIND